jgi:hypothetical protein
MSSDSNAEAWDRVAAELRACRQAQQRAWGDLDNDTLGRYLAGDASGDERRRVESALEDLPELRKLVDLVGDVLNAFEPEAAPAPVVPEPVVLSFQAPAKRRPFRGRLLQWSALAAAACLLLTLGLLLTRTFGPSSTPSPEGFALVSPDRGPRADPPPEARDPDSLRSKAEVMKASLSSPPDAPFSAPRSSAPLADGKLPSDRELETRLAFAERKAQELEKEGKPQQARKEIALAAASANRVALRLQQEGEWGRAETLLQRTHRLCREKLGLGHEETKRSRSVLTQTYQVALNAPANQGSKSIELGVGAGASSALPTPRAHGKGPWPGEYVAPMPTLPGGRGTGDNLNLKADRARETAADLRQRLEQCDPRRLRTTVVPVLMEALKEAGSPQERAAVAPMLGQLGPAAREAVPLLAEYLQKAGEPREQQAILDALAQMGPAARKAVPALVKLLHHGNPDVRRHAVQTLVRLGPAARSRVPALCQRVEGKDEAVQEVLRRLEGHEGRIGICDDCDCFTVQALGISVPRIEALANSSGIEVLVETTPTLPHERKADERARELVVHGVYLLLVRDVPAVQVSVHADLQEQGLTADRVRGAVEPGLKEKDFDQALVEGIRAVQRFAEARAAKKSP